MGRSKKKGPFVDPKLYRKVELMDAANKKDPIKTWARACTIVPEFVGHTFMVHNGKLHRRCLSRKIWSDIGWASFRPRGLSAATAAG